MGCASGLALILNGWGDRKGQDPAPQSYTPISSVMPLQVGSPTYRPGSYPPVGTSSAGRPGTGSYGPCPLGTSLPPPGTCRWRELRTSMCCPDPGPQALGMFALTASSPPRDLAGLPRGACPSSPIDESPPHTPLEEAAAAIAGVDAVVLPTAAVPAHAALDGGAHA